MDVSPTTLSSLSALVVSLITVVWAILHFASLVKVREDLAALKIAQAANVVKIELFWRMLESRVGSLVKAPTHERMDALVDSFKHTVMTIPELQELQELLGVRAGDEALQPIQEDAVALVLLFVADRLAKKRAVQTQTEMEQQQVRDKERKPADAR